MQKAVRNSLLTRTSLQGKFEETVVQDIEQTNNSVQKHPQNRMIYAPRDCNRQHTAEAPETDTCRLMILHSSSLLSRKENCFPTFSHAAPFYTDQRTNTRQFLPTLFRPFLPTAPP